LITHCIAASVACRSLSIVGTATLTTDSSTNANVDPNTAVASTHFLRRTHAVTLVPARMTASAQGKALGLLTFAAQRCVPPRVLSSVAP
jgi:hypothetical protein